MIEIYVGIVIAKSKVLGKKAPVYWDMM